MKKILDDGNEENYRARIHTFKQQQQERRQRRLNPSSLSSSRQEESSDEEYLPPVDENDEELSKFYQYEDLDDVSVGNGLYIPAFIYYNLYSYQIQGIQWFWQLHQNQAGGILGDQMGLGKTIQVISFLECLRQNRTYQHCLLLCPGSVLFQWVREFQKWSPYTRVVLGHREGSGSSIDQLELIVQNIMEKSGVLIMTYEALRQKHQAILSYNFDYVVLDEGHRIRNPDAEITMLCKQFRTVHRLMLTGTPIQNRLKELWSLIDFVHPGKLGTLPTFEDEFVLPIRQGSFVKATKMQIEMGFKCALMLQDLIKPHLLQRLKSQVAIEMPSKTEQVIFCHLGPLQKRKYLKYLGTSEVADAINRATRPFRAIMVLRKICNHADLAPMGEELDNVREDDDEAQTTFEGKSGKLSVVETILSMWNEQKHRVLLFCQTRSMLDILERYVRSKAYTYLRLDGTTPMKLRQQMIDEFNQPDSKIFIFLLTTRAGGIGVNLTGANRVLIYDPDWNPSTDVQARERSWRLGQLRNVTIYRLITCGTIEEKIYHRQLYKQHLSTKVLRNAKQRRRFSRKSLIDLFTYTDELEGKAAADPHQQDIDTSTTTTGTETGDLFLAGHVPKPSETPSEVDVLQRRLGSRTNIQSVNTDSRAIEEEEGEASASDMEKLSSDERSAEDEQSEQDNETLLSQLFQGNGVRSVFSHDAVEKDDGLDNQERVLIQMEAKKIADLALKTLEKSRDNIEQKRQGVHVPTWTGKQGTAGAPLRRPKRSISPGGSLSSSASEQKKPRTGISMTGTSSSRQLLDRMRSRHIPTTPSSTPRAASSSSRRKRILTMDEVAVEIRSFMHRPRTTEQILHHFQNLVSVQNKLAFRELLRKLAKCSGGFWELRPKYS